MSIYEIPNVDDDAVSGSGSSDVGLSSDSDSDSDEIAAQLAQLEAEGRDIAAQLEQLEEEGRDTAARLEEKTTRNRAIHREWCVKAQLGREGEIEDVKFMASSLGLGAVAKRWPAARVEVRNLVGTEWALVYFTAPLVFLSVCAGVVAEIGSLATSMLVGSLVGLATCALARHAHIVSQEWDIRRTLGQEYFFSAKLMVVPALWSWMLALTVVPAALFAAAEANMAGGDGTAAATLGAIGVFVLVAALWMLGWAFLWYRVADMAQVEPAQHLTGMPPYFSLRLKLLSVVGECYNYCGFSFFP
jgi:hypothetical protein